MAKTCHIMLKTMKNKKFIKNDEKVQNIQRWHKLIRNEKKKTIKISG